MSLKLFISTLIFLHIWGVSEILAQSILFDFNSAQVYTPLPISQTVGGVTAEFSATAQGYSIQSGSTATVVPAGFTGNFIFPSSVYLSDLLIHFSKNISDFSIWYSCQELGCDDAATMRVTAYLKGIYIGSNTKVASNPGTWPVDTLSCSFPQGFDSVVVHYDKKPPTCQDYGVIFIVDNMRVTPMQPNSLSNHEKNLNGLRVSNPNKENTTISFSILHHTDLHIAAYDLTGRCIKTLFDGPINPGEHQINWEVKETIESGLYLIHIFGDDFFQSEKTLVIK